MNAVAIFDSSDDRTRLTSTRIIPAYNYDTDWTEERHEQKRKGTLWSHENPHFGPSNLGSRGYLKPCQITCTGNETPHGMHANCIFRPNIAVIDLNGIPLLASTQLRTQRGLWGGFFWPVIHFEKYMQCRCFL